MTPFAQLNRLSNYFIGGYKSVLHGRSNLINLSQTCTYTRKSAEAKLGIEKPKRPLTPFFKFMTQMRPALIAKKPGISSKETTLWASKHWQELDIQTKNQMTKEYEKDLEDYKKIKAIYESSLTDQQKQDIQRLKEEMATAREKRKLKAELKELGRPKKPMSSFLLYAQSRKEKLNGKTLKEFQLIIKEGWMKLSATEKAKFEKQAQDLMTQYKKDLQAWELKMISLGREDLVRTKQLREKKSSKTVKTQ